MRRRSHYLLIAILLLGAGLRAAYLIDFSKGPDFASPGVDAEFHDYWARALVTGDWTPPLNSEDPAIQTTPYLRPPGYPYFLAGVYRILGLSYFAPRIVQMALGLLSAVIAFFIGRRWIGNITGLVAEAILACHWAFIYFEGELHAPPLMIFITLLMMVALGRWAEKPRWPAALIAGILFGLAALVLPNVLLFGPFAMLWMRWVHRRGVTKSEATRNRPLREFIPSAAALALGAAVAIAPATIRNYRASGEFVLITTNGGINLYIGNHDGAEGLCLVELPELGKFETCFDYPALVRQLESKERRKLTHGMVDAYFRARAIDFITRHPGDFLRVTLRKALMFWGPSEISHNKEVALEREHSAALRLIPENFSMILAAAVAGWIGFTIWNGKNRGTRSKPDKRMTGSNDRADARAAAQQEATRFLQQAMLVLFALYVAAFFLSILPFFNAARYRVPVIPFLGFFAGMAVQFIVESVRAGQRKRAAGVVVAACATWGILQAWPYRFTPDRSNWHYSRGVCYSRQNRLEDAVREYEAALRADEANARAHFNLAVALQQRGAVAEATSHFAKAGRAAEYRTQSLRGSASALAQAGRWDEAADVLIRMLQDDPTDTTSKFGLAYIRAEQGRPAEAINVYREVLKEDARNYDAMSGIGAAFGRAGQWADAAAAYRDVVTAWPDRTEPKMLLADALAKSGAWDEAEASLRSALRQDADSRDAALNLCYVLSHRGRDSDAIAILESWLLRHPEDEAAARRLQELRRSATTSRPSSRP